MNCRSGHMKKIGFYLIDFLIGLITLFSTISSMIIVIIAFISIPTAKGFEVLGYFSVSILFLLPAIELIYLVGNRARYYSKQQEGKIFMYTFERKNGHIEVYLNGVFQFSADTLAEAKAELANNS